MKFKTHLAHSIEVAEYESQYDAQITNTLANKQVLARIAKGVAKEFADYDPELIETWIEGEPQISMIPLYPGKSHKERITGLSTASKIPNEGEITYDIRFNIITPEKEIIKIIFNIEGQKKYYVGYDFVPRGIFYCARMISEQLDTEFTADDYNQIKKVYSVFVCTESPEWAANTITTYEMQPKNVYGNYSGEAKYDLLSVAIIRLSKNGKIDTGNELLHMLTVLLSHTLDAETKKKILQEEHQMKMTKELEGGMSTMGGWGAILIEEGEARGKVRGETQAKCSAIRNVRQIMNISDIVNILKYEEDFVRKVIALLDEYPEATDKELVEMLFY